jgi:hypothetical protein
MKPRALILLEATELEVDLALDFIENEVGGNQFIQNWDKLKSQGDPTEKVANWMQKIGAEADPIEIVKVIQDYAEQGAVFLTPFTTPVPYNE